LLLDLDRDVDKEREREGLEERRMPFITHIEFHLVDLVGTESAAGFETENLA